MSRDKPNKPRTPPLTVQPDERGQALIRRKRGLDLVDARAKAKAAKDKRPNQRQPTPKELQDQIDLLYAIIDTLLDKG